MPELDRCPSPRQSIITTEEGEASVEDKSKSKRLLVASDISKYQSRTGSMIDLSEIKRRRRKKRRIIVQNNRQQHFQLSPQGGAISKGLVEKLPPDIEGAAATEVVPIGRDSDLDSVQSGLTSLELSEKETRDSRVDSSSLNGETAGIDGNLSNTKREEGIKERKTVTQNTKRSRPLSLNESQFSPVSNGYNDRSLTRSIPSLLNKEKEAMV